METEVFFLEGGGGGFRPVARRVREEQRPSQPGILLR